MQSELQCKVEQIRRLVNSERFLADVAKTDQGQKAAGTRVRGVMQEVKNLAQGVRQEVVKLRG